MGVAPGVVVGGRVRAPVRFPGCGQDRWGAVGHPFAENTSVPFVEFQMTMSGDFVLV